jgi:tetratricopeptide (TPR) repeat protein
MLRARLYYGYNMYNNGNFDKATEVYKDILNNFPNNQEACYYLGIIYFYKGNVNDAIQYFDVMASDLNILREKCIYHYQMAKLYKEKDKDRALKEFTIAKYLFNKIIQSINISEEKFEDL